MRKLLMLFTIVALVAALTSCGKKKEPAPATDTQTEATQAAGEAADSMEMMEDSMGSMDSMDMGDMEDSL